MAKTKALISFAVTAKMICVFVFAYSKSRFSDDEAHMMNALAGLSLCTGLVANATLYVLSYSKVP